MGIINVNQHNIDREHICCAITDKKGEPCVTSKKQWMKRGFDEGLTFKKLDVRGKVFIEYMPAENAWCPIEAPGYMFINCFWVSGKYKGKGHGNNLLEECIHDAKFEGKKGLVVVSSKKKMPFLSDPKYLKYKGFELCDVAEPYYELLHLPFKGNVGQPKFKACCKKGITTEMGIVLYYSNQCPHTEKYAPLIAQIAREKNIDFTLIKIKTREQAQSVPTPFTTFSLFYQGQLVTNEILSEKKFIKFLEEKGLS